MGLKDLYRRRRLRPGGRGCRLAERRHRCAKGGLTVENPAQDEALCLNYRDYDYDRFYAAHDFDYVERVEASFLRAILRGLLDLPDGAAVVDLGCGTGFDTWLIDRMGYRAVGIDSSRVAVEKARQRGGGAQFVLGNALSAHAQVGSGFDVAYCSGFMAFNWVTSLEDE